MFVLAALIVLISVAIATSRTIQRNRAIFQEFGQSAGLATAVWLYPIPAVLALLPVPLILLLFIGVPLGVGFFIPGMLIASANRKGFEVAGTDRVDPVQHAASHAFYVGILGILGTLVASALFWLFHSALRPN